MAREKPVEVLEPFDLSPGSKAQLRCYLGQDPASSVGRAAAVLVDQPDGRHLWIGDADRTHPCLSFSGYLGPKAIITVRFHFGTPDRIYLARCAFHPGLGHCLNITSDPSAGDFIHFYRHRDFEEWAGETGYQGQQMALEAIQDTGELADTVASLRNDGWECHEDRRLGLLWARRKAA